MTRTVLMIGAALFSALLFTPSSQAFGAQRAVAARGAGPSVDINTADAKTIARRLDGVGKARARAIVAWREKHGRFRAVDDLQRVDGIGRATVESNRERIRVRPH